MRCLQSGRLQDIAVLRVDQRTCAAAPAALRTTLRAHLAATEWLARIQAVDAGLALRDQVESA
jgi:hypothetical protein